jgi:hypothetical protein
MSIRNLLVAVPFALGIACSHSSKSHAAASGGSPPGAQASSGYGGTIVTTAGAPSTGKDQGGTGSSSDGSAASGSSAGSSEGAQGGGAMGGQMGSGGSSEATGTDKPAEGAAPAGEGMSQHEGDKKVSGKLSKVSKSEVTVTRKDGTATKLKIADQTIVMMNGKEAKPTQLKQGQAVHASYQEQGDDHVAVKIEVGKQKAQGHHGTPGSSGHTQGSGSSGSGSSGSGSDMGGSSGSGSDPSK